MDEREWLASSDAGAMLEWWRGECGPERSRLFGRARILTARKLRLLACAACRAVWHLLTDDAPCPGHGVPPSHIGCLICSGTGHVNRSRAAVEVAERYADGLATEEELAAARAAARDAARGAARGAAWDAARDAAKKVQAALLRCLAGNPFRPPALTKCRRCDGDGKAHGSDRPFEWTPEVGYPGPCPVCRGVKYAELASWLRWNGDTAVKLARMIYDGRLWQDMPILADALGEAGCEDGGLLGHCRGPGPHARGCWVVDLILGKE